MRASLAEGETGLVTQTLAVVSPWMDRVVGSVRVRVPEGAHAEDPTCWNLRGVILGDLHRRADAVAAFRRATDLDPDCAVYWTNLGCGLVETREPDRAEAALRQALSLRHGYWPAHECLAGIYRRRGDEAAARVELERALVSVECASREHPFSRDVTRALGRLNERLGRYDRSDAARSVSERLALEDRIGGLMEEWVCGAATEGA